MTHEPPAHEPLVDTAAVTITKGDIRTDHAISGTINDQPGYSFHAKVFDVGSKYGIDHGRISKLQVQRDGRTVANYDREWDTVPDKPADRRAVETIVGAFPEPERRPGPADCFDRAARGMKHRSQTGRVWDDPGRGR